MIWFRRLFGVLLIAVAIILVFSIIVTLLQATAYFTSLYLCITEGCDGDTLKDTLFGILTYIFMGSMVYYLGRRGFLLLIAAKPEEPEPSPILDEADFSHIQENINSFQTKYGYCHILPDRIIFANSKTLEDVSAYKEGNKIIGTLILQFTLFFAMGIYFFTEAMEGDFWQMLTPALVALVSLFSIVTSFRNSTTPLIMRGKIISINFVKGVPYMITPHFVIWFYDSKNRKRKRLVTLFDNAAKNSSEALLVFRNASLPVVE
jgi:hypothetical protein